MRERALSTHAIPVNERFPLAISSKAVVYKIITFLSEDGNTNCLKTIELPPVFTLDYNVERVDHTVEEEINDCQKVSTEYLQLNPY